MRFAPGSVSSTSAKMSEATLTRFVIFGLRALYFALVTPVRRFHDHIDRLALLMIGCFSGRHSPEGGWT
ncbi:MAG: hypothetical protein ACKOBM_16185 [Gammaproteobacteria bacterium]